MKTNRIKQCHLSGMAAAVISLFAPIIHAYQPDTLKWEKAANNKNVIPGTTTLFNSYNQPSVNTSGYVVFRARGKGTEPVSGIYARDMKNPGATIRITDRATSVPGPNNTTYPPDNILAVFNEFPSIPRISMTSQTIATRGNSQPVWTYQVDGADTKVGTNGVFLNTGGNLITGVNLLGAVPSLVSPVVGENYFPYMAVPGVTPPTRFDVFPGSPAVADGDKIVFKGNYTVDGAGKTGVFFRDPISGGGVMPVELIANSGTVIPNLPTGIAGVLFGSTAPPSAAGGLAVFAGFDNEESPLYGGIYLAPLISNPQLTTLVGIGDPVPGEVEAKFNRFGEALAFDGRYVAFWGAWGTDQITLWLDCPTDGNKDLLAYCQEFYGDNYPVKVPANQGIFVIDTKTAEVHQVAKNKDYFADFVYWNFSGKPPGVGGSEEGDDGEPPRWRSTSFVAVSAGPDDTFMVAFKARSGSLDPINNNYLNPVDGIYLGDQSTVSTLLDTTMDGQYLDPEAPVGSIISTLGIERESFRGKWLAITAGMVESASEASMSGIYVGKAFADPAPPSPPASPAANPEIYTRLRLANIVAGRYYVASDPNGPKKQKVTMITLAKNGKFNGQLVINGKKFTLSGKLNRAGETYTRIRDKKKTFVVRLVAAEVNGVRVLDITVVSTLYDYHKRTALAQPAKVRK